MRKASKIIILPLITAFIFIVCSHFTGDDAETEKIVALVSNKDVELISNEDIELIALVTMAEAEGECEEGKRLVIDTILNRVNSKHFPNTIYDVIYQPKHFSSMWNGRIDRCEVREDICQLVREEIESRTNYDVIFFTSGHYSKYGVPLFKVGNHYFSSYD
jgi:N-acetylmuramoyl-L-alanine amidase